MSVPSKVQKYCDKVRGDVERQSPESFDMYEAVDFKYMEKHDGSEAYFVKIKTSGYDDDDEDDDDNDDSEAVVALVEAVMGANRFVHVKIVVKHNPDCGKTVLLKDVQLGKSRDDPLKKF